MHTHHNKADLFIPHASWSLLKNDVNGRSLFTPGGLQCIKTVDGYVFPLNVRDGLPYLDAEFESLPHVILTSDVDWDPRVMDFDVANNEAWYEEILDDRDHSALFDEFGNYMGRNPDLKVSCADTWYDAITPSQHDRKEVEEATYICAEHAYRVQHFNNEEIMALRLAIDTELCATPNLIEDDDDDDETVAQVVPTGRILDNDSPSIIEDDDRDDVTMDKDTSGDIKDAPACTFKVNGPDYEKVRPLFGWQDAKTIKKTFENTT